MSIVKIALSVQKIIPISRENVSSITAKMEKCLLEQSVCHSVLKELLKRNRFVCPDAKKENIFWKVFVTQHVPPTRILIFLAYLLKDVVTTQRRGE